MSDAKITREDAQAEISGLLVAEICLDFGTNFHGVYPDYILARGVGPEQSFIGLAIKRGHLVRADLVTADKARIAELESQIDKLRKALTFYAPHEANGIQWAGGDDAGQRALSALKETKP